MGGKKDVQMDEWGWMEGWMHRQIYRQTDRQKRKQGMRDDGKYDVYKERKDRWRLKKLWMMDKKSI